MPELAAATYNLGNHVSKEVPRATDAASVFLTFIDCITIATSGPESIPNPKHGPAFWPRESVSAKVRRK